ncbi:TPA: hypothetical protein HA361_02540 [Candidatus Woesearchaeota archaeon]|nr:hypothetical protein [Candidatus Woesearchaeota archaeon]HII68910.1 hypothetical protein [Candidatus Woesearchaeota archaeon]
MKRETEQVVAVLLIIGIIIAGTTLLLIRYRLAGITGFAVNPNATVTLTVQDTASLTFLDSSISWGTVAVNVSKTNTCILTTTPGYTTDSCTDGAGGSVTPETSGLAIENDGNTNLTVTLISNVTGSQFIGSNAVFEWNVTNIEVGSCLNATGDAVAPNTTTFESVTTTEKVICYRLRYIDASDSLNISINLTIPYDAPTGAKAAKLTATGTTV